MPFNATERLRFLPLALIGAGFGWLAVTFALLGVEPEPRLHGDTFHLTRGEDRPLEVTAIKPVAIPFPFGDFDAVAELELPEGGELDVLIRVVEPMSDAAPFHGRFGLLRLSTIKAGPGVLSREDALFDDPDAGGIRIGAGFPATLHIKARGHLVRATVAGQPVPWFEVPDDFGALSFVHRGAGTSLLRYLNIQPLQRQAAADPWLWAAVIGAAIGLMFGLFGARFGRSVAALAALPMAGAACGLVVFSLLMIGTRPSTTATLAAVLSGLPLVAAIASRARWRGFALAGAIMLLLWEMTARIERPRIAALEDPRLTAYFGRNSGSMPFDLLSGQLSATTAIHRARKVDRRIVFAGGGHWFEAGGTRGLAENLAPLAAARSAQLAGIDVDGVVVPTLWSTIDGQIALLADFIDPRFDPDLVVFAISSDELTPSEPRRPREVFDQGAAVARHDGVLSVLLSAWRESLRSDVAPGTPATVAAAMDRLAQLAAERRFKVVLYRAEPLPPELASVVDAAATAHGWPVIDRQPDEPMIQTAERHAEVFAKMLAP